MEGLVGLLISLVIYGLIFYLLWWLVGYMGLPQPFDKVVRVLIALFAILVIIDVLFGVGMGIPRMRLR